MSIDVLFKANSDDEIDGYSTSLNAVPRVGDYIQHKPGLWKVDAVVWALPHKRVEITVSWHGHYV